MTQFHEGHPWFYFETYKKILVLSSWHYNQSIDLREHSRGTAADLNSARRMNIQGVQPLIILALFTASVITIVHCLPMMDVSTLKQTGRIKANILGQLSLTEPPLPDEALTEDEEKVVAAFQDYHTAKEARRAHVKRSMPTITTTFVGKLQKHGK